MQFQDTVVNDVWEAMWRQWTIMNDAKIVVINNDGTSNLFVNTFLSYAATIEVLFIAFQQSTLFALNISPLQLIVDSAWILDRCRLGGWVS